MNRHIVVCGGRDFDDYQRMSKILTGLIIPSDIILCGMAKGADLLAYRWAVDNDAKVEDYPADWNKNGKSAGYIRNALMVDNATHVLAFWNGVSKGTKHTIDYARKKKLAIKIVSY